MLENYKTLATARFNESNSQINILVVIQHNDVVLKVMQVMLMFMTGNKPQSYYWYQRLSNFQKEIGYFG